jgi:hypothetical protein
MCRSPGPAACAPSEKSKQAALNTIKKNDLIFIVTLTYEEMKKGASKKNTQKLGTVRRNTDPSSGRK